MQTRQYVFTAWSVFVLSGLWVLECLRWLVSVRPFLGFGASCFMYCGKGVLLPAVL